MAVIYEGKNIFEDQGGGQFKDMNTGAIGTLESLRAQSNTPNAGNGPDNNAGSTQPVGGGGTTITPSLENRFEDVIGQNAQQAGLGGTAPQLPTGTAVTPVDQQVQTNELEASPVAQPAPTVTTNTAKTDDLVVNKPTQFQTPTIDPETVSEDTPTATAAQGTVGDQSQIDLNAAKGTVSEESLADAQTEDLDEKATMTYQLGKLYESIQDGKPLPAWAAGPARAAAQIMMSRGLGASSMASAAIVQSIMESALPIASQDAQSYSKIQITNLTNRQATALQNAATYAAMDQKNLDARMQALVTNSRSFLEMDLANLNNRQATEQINYQGRIQTLLSDQAAINAAKTFNATNETQVQEFFAKLGVEVDTGNAQRLGAMEQFNTDQANAMNRFQATLDENNNQFYTKMQQEINQSNVLWRRTVNTQNTAVQNEAQKINAQSLLGLTVDAQNKLWQQYRDEATFLMNTAENDRQRAHNAAMVASQNNFSIQRYNQEVRDNFWSSVGSAVIDSIFS